MEAFELSAAAATLGGRDEFFFPVTIPSRFASLAPTTWRLNNPPIDFPTTGRDLPAVGLSPAKKVLPCLEAAAAAAASPRPSEAGGDGDLLLPFPLVAAAAAAAVVGAVAVTLPPPPEIFGFPRMLLLAFSCLFVLLIDEDVEAVFALLLRPPSPPFAPPPSPRALAVFLSLSPPVADLAATTRDRGRSAAGAGAATAAAPFATFLPSLPLAAAAPPSAFPFLEDPPCTAFSPLSPSTSMSSVTGVDEGTPPAAAARSLCAGDAARRAVVSFLADVVVGEAARAMC